MYQQVVPIRFDPRNVAHGNEKRARLFSNQQAFRESALPEDFLDQTAKARRGDIATLGVMLANAAQHVAKAIFRDRLEEVIESVHLEST